MEIKSNKGFYIEDLSYVISDKIYNLKFDDFKGKKFYKINVVDFLESVIFSSLWFAFGSIFLDYSNVIGVLFLIEGGVRITNVLYRNFNNILLERKIKKREIQEKLLLKEEDFLVEVDLADFFNQRKQELLSVLTNKEDTLVMKDIYQKYY